MLVYHAATTGRSEKNYICSLGAGDNLSTLLFLLSLNPLSYTLKLQKGYLLGVNSESQTQLFPGHS